MIKIKPGQPSSEQILSDEIYRNFDSDYLELVRLLKEAAGVEHLLMLQYLYAAFSIKDKYIAVRGEMRPAYYMTSVTSDLLGVAIEEMRHLRAVNSFLAALGVSPNVLPHDFNDVSDIYPFDIKLESLSLQSTAKYCYIEADNTALDINAPGHTPEDKIFIKNVLSEIGGAKPNHLGSLYAYIINFARKVAENPPDFLKGQYIDWNKFENDMLEVKGQGEKAHFHFFKLVFTATHDGFPNKHVWEDPCSDDYPSVKFYDDQRTAYLGHKDVIKDKSDRITAWLGNLHYWIILALLDLNYRNVSMKMKYKAIANMTEPLVTIGFFLAKRLIGMPFDIPVIKPNMGNNTQSSLQIIRLLVIEARETAFKLKEYLPEDFNYAVYDNTLAGLTDEIS